MKAKLIHAEYYDDQVPNVFWEIWLIEGEKVNQLYCIRCQHREKSMSIKHNVEFLERHRACPEK
jgi:hypothetical protein